MAEYPTAIYSPRTIENKSGVVYDPLKKTVIYAEDYQKANDEIVAIQETIGTDPTDGGGSIKTYLAWFLELITDMWNNKQDKGNMQTGFLSDSTTFYPSSHTVQSALNQATYGYPLLGYSPGGSGSTWAASTAWYFGSQFNYYMTTTATLNKIYIPKGGTITQCQVTLRTGGTASSGQAGTLYIRKNNSTDYQIATYTCGAGNTIWQDNWTSLNIPVNAGDYIEFKFVTPAWTTLPTMPGLRCQPFIVTPY